MAKRRARTADTARLPQLAVDAWTLEVENLLGVRTPVRRNEVLRYAAALLLVRRWVALNRCGHSRASRYSRLPRDVAALGRMEFSGVFAYAAGGARAVEDTTVLNVLQCVKVNDEMFDFCTALFDSALAGAHSAQEAEWKAYVMARTSSRAAAGLQAFHASWDSLQHGLDLLLSEARREGVEPRQLFSQSFGPNRRLHNECSGSVRHQEAYVRAAFDVLLPELAWVQPVGATGGQAQHTSKEGLREQLLAWPHVGPLTGKNIFQLLRRAPLFQPFHAAAARTRHANEHFGFTSAGARMCLNLLTSEPAGRGFLRDACGMGAMRHFSAQLVHFRRALLVQMRALAGNSRTLQPVVDSFESQDETFFCFSFCELWKVLAYLATGDIRYELDYLDEA